MVKPLVAANWKMHGSKEFIASYSQQLQQTAVQDNAVDIVIFPPAVYLAETVSALSAAGIGDIDVGAQNSSDQLSGALTGEVSVNMLVDVGCRYVLVGHSERRALFGESSQQVATKFVTAQSNGLIPVLCVGETLSQRESGNTLPVVKEQLDAVIDLAGLAAVNRSVIAYEPVWAIGTGLTATPEQAQQVHREIRHFLGEDGVNTRILYGGSVKANNAGALFSQPDIDGGLVGGASLNATEFAAICSSAN